MNPLYCHRCGGELERAWCKDCGAYSAGGPGKSRWLDVAFITLIGLGLGILGLLAARWGLQ